VCLHGSQFSSRFCVCSRRAREVWRSSLRSSLPTARRRNIRTASSSFTFCVTGAKTRNSLDRLTLYGHINTVQQRTIIQQYGDRYTWRVGCYIWYSEEGPGRAAVPPRPLFAVPNVTVHPSTTSVPTGCGTIIAAALYRVNMSSSDSRWGIVFGRPCVFVSELVRLELAMKLSK